MAGEVNDPIADLAKEIEAEVAADDKKSADGATGEDKANVDQKTGAKAEAAADDTGDEGDKTGDEGDESAEGETEEGTEEKAAGEEDEAAKEAKTDEGDRKRKSQERLIPVSERNKEAAARRRAERELEQARAELASLKQTKPKEGEDKVEITEEQRDAAARARARLEIQLEEFVSYGNKTFGVGEDKKPVFDAACNMLADMGAPQNLVAIAMEAAGSPADAAKVVYRLSQEEPEEIERIFALTPGRQIAALAKLSVSRPRRATAEDTDEEEDAPVLGRKAGKVSKAPPPVKPLQGNKKVPEGLGDEVPDDVFTDRFFQMLEKPRGRAAH